MLSASLLEKIKHVAIALVMGAVVSVIPFYFETKEMTEANTAKIIELTETLHLEQERIKQIEVGQAVDNAEIVQIKSSLDRIEKKIDRLIERAH